MPLLTVVIPFRDRPELLRRLLDSLDGGLTGGGDGLDGSAERQSEVAERRNEAAECQNEVAELQNGAIELLFVDNRSGNEALSLVESFARRHNKSILPQNDVARRHDDRADTPLVRIEHQEKGGAAAARNRGLDLARGEYVYFFDSDDEISLCGVMAAARLAKRENADVVGIGTNIVAQDGHEIKKPFAPTADPKRQIVANNFATQSLLLRTAWARLHGRWDESLNYWIDWEWALRILLARPRMVFFRNRINRIFLHSNSITGTGYARRLPDILKAHAVAGKDIMEAGLAPAERLRLLRALEGRKILYAAHIYKEEENASKDDIRSSKDKVRGSNEDNHASSRQLLDSVSAGYLSLSAKQLALPAKHLSLPAKQLSLPSKRLSLPNKIFSIPYEIRLRLAYLLTCRGIRGAWRLV